MPLSKSRALAQASNYFPCWPEAIYSAKTFAAAMLALGIAFSINLDRPYWAMLSAYIVSQPLTGALRSKAVYRFAGTLMGAAVTLALVPNLDSSPELLSVALALWIGLCLYFSLLDRTPRSYVFLLGGYSTALIGFPAVSDPASMWDIAVARVEEVTLGIICTAAIGSIVVPRSVGEVLTGGFDAWFGNIKRWSSGILEGRNADELLPYRQRLAADAVELHLLSTMLAYDTPPARDTRRAIFMYRRRMIMLLPVLISISDCLTELKTTGGPSPSLKRLLQAVDHWIGSNFSEPPADALRSIIACLNRPLDVHAGWSDLVEASLREKLLELLTIVEECQRLHRLIATGDAAPPPIRFFDSAADADPWHRDPMMALLSAAGVVMTVVLACTLWIATAWPDGTFAPEVAAVGICFFAAQDDPVPALVAFAYSIAAALVIDAIYLFAIFPRIDGFPLLALALAPTYFLLGIGMAKKSLIAMAMTFSGITFLSLQETYSADFAAFINGGTAAIVGLVIAATVLGIFRSVGAEVAAMSLIQAGWADLAELALRPEPSEQEGFVGRMIDRLGLLVPRLAAIPSRNRVSMPETPTDLRIGLNVIQLQRHPASPEFPAGHNISRVLAGVAAHFSAQRSRGATISPSPDLLKELDDTLHSVLMSRFLTHRLSILVALTGIRRCLFPNETFQPLLAEPEEVEAAA